MIKNLPFSQHAAEYEEWFERYPYLFQTELAAIKKIWPTGKNLVSLDIGAATGLFTSALNITEGLEPAANMSAIAEARGVNTWCGIAESLPYQSGQFDAVLMNFCISYLDYPERSFKEIFRVLKSNGCLIVGFLDKESQIGKEYEKRKPTSLFYKAARFYSVAEVTSMLTEAGFTDLSFSQTLFGPAGKINRIQESLPGYGKGSYVLIKAVKK